MNLFQSYLIQTKYLKYIHRSETSASAADPENQETYYFSIPLHFYSEIY